MWFYDGEKSSFSNFYGKSHTTLLKDLGGRFPSAVPADAGAEVPCSAVDGPDSL